VSNSRTIRPLINSEPVSEFGAAMGDLPPNETVAPDLLRVPGFSELRETRDYEMAEYAAGRRHGKDVSVLPANVRWVAATAGADGVQRSKKLMAAANAGYKPVTKDMLPGGDGKAKHAWLTAMPPGARVNPDGTISNAAGDLQLQWCDQATAGRNQARKARATSALVDGVGGNLGNGAEGFLAATTNRAGIADAYVERSTPKS